MPLTNAGTIVIANALEGAAYTAYNAANSYIGVGDNNAVFAKTQTDLQASTNKIRKPMDATFPTLLGNVITFQTTFGPTDANFDWNEWGVFNDPTTGTMLNRKMAFLGTKTSAQTWVLVGILTVNNP
jgi:hypothetical protein